MFNFVSINIYLDRIFIQTCSIYILGIFSNVYRKTYVVIISNGSTITLIIKILVFGRDRLNILNLAKDRSISIVASFGIIYCKIINKESIHAGNTGSRLPVIFTGRTSVKLTAYFYSGACACCRVCRIPRFVLLKRNTVILTNVYYAVSPAGFLKIQSIAVVDRISINANFFSILSTG